ncbi:MAG: helix-turn-helix transcriptional regulator [Solirubrobacteraceae bacterium]
MNDFDQLIRDIDAEARTEGPAAVSRLRTFEVQFTLPADLIALRKARGLSQEQLAKASGVQQADISKIEQGRRRVAVAALVCQPPRRCAGLVQERELRLAQRGTKRRGLVRSPRIKPSAAGPDATCARAGDRGPSARSVVGAPMRTHVLATIHVP